MTVQSKGGFVSAGTDREGVTREWTIRLCGECGLARMRAALIEIQTEAEYDSEWTIDRLQIALERIHVAVRRALTEGEGVRRER